MSLRVGVALSSINLIREASLSSVDRVTDLILLFAVACSSINIVPVLLVPLSVAGLLLAVVSAYFGRPPSIPLSARSYAVYIVASVAYVVVTGIDIFQYALFRRELKFIVPFGAFIIFSILRYHRPIGQAIYSVLITIAFGSFGYFVLTSMAAVILGQYDNPLFPATWEQYEPGRVLYLGQFITHSAAGGFFAALGFILLGLSINMDRQGHQRTIALLAVFGVLVMLLATSSRAFMLATLVTGLYIGAERSRWHALAKKFFFPMIAMVFVGLLLGRLSGVGGMMTESVSGSETIRSHNITVRWILWREAINDFLRSPLTGIGISRFDDSTVVVSTLPAAENVTKGDQQFIGMRYLAEIDMGPGKIHTDQHAHNVYLHILAEGGLLFFLLAVVIWKRTMKLLMDYCSVTSGMERGLAEGIRYALICVAIASLFGNNLLAVIPMCMLLSLAGYVQSMLHYGSARAS